MKALVTAIAAAVLMAAALPAQAGSRPPQGEQTTSLAHVVRILEEDQSAREELVSRMSPLVEALQRALGEVDAALAAEGMSDRERMDNAARSTDGVLTAIDAVLAHEADVRKLFTEQSRKLTEEWRRASVVGGATGAAGEAQREARFARSRVAAQLALAPDTPEEWRSLFELAFDLLEASADGDSELAQQQREIWAETVSLLAQLRQDVYANFANDISSFEGLRTMRASKLLQKELLVSGRDLEGLREVSRSLHAVADMIVRPDENGNAVTSQLRELMDRGRDALGSSPARTRSPEERRRAMLARTGSPPPTARR
ncbi:MAG: hypothetical protein IPM29_04460 [Planctomycetes bacterium]|nr:hypothetical protein [Planctomycetota bacterium]